MTFGELNREGDPLFGGADTAFVDATGGWIVIWAAIAVVGRRDWRGCWREGSERCGCGAGIPFG
jgi:hypothetical protein